LTKVKAKQPTKTFEDKSESEKKATFGKASATSGGAKSIMKKPGQPKKNNKLQFGECQVFEYDKDPEASVTAIKDDTATKDISDMRDEKSKMKDKLQE
jgi:hypothetical protein